MTTVGPVPPPLPLPTAPTTTTATGAAGTGATPAPSAPVITENAVQALTAILVSLPEALRARPTGSQVAGTLVGQDANGLQLLRTADGTVTLRGLAGLPVGTQLALALPDGAASGTAVRLSLLRPSDAAIIAQQTPATPAPPLTPGQVFTAALVQQTGVQQAGAQQSGLTRIGPGIAGNYAATAIGANFDVRLLSVGGQESTQGAVAAAAGNAVVTASVVGRTSGGLLVINAGFGVLTLPAQGQVTPGQTLQLELLGRQQVAETLRPPPTSALLPASGPPADAQALARDWEALRQAIETLRSIDPQLAQAMVGRATARPGDGFAMGLMFMVVALRGGNLSNLLGEPAMRALERAGRGNLLSRLNDEFTTLNRLATEPAGDWRAFFVPVQHPDGALTPVRLFFRKPRGARPEQQTATRFVVETELTRLGPLQIDGLARSTRVDMILRTREALPDQAQNEIGAIFRAATDTDGFAGSIAFQAIERFPIDPLDEIGGHVEGVVA